MKIVNIAYEKLKKIGTQNIIKKCLLRKVKSQFIPPGNSRHVNIMISGFTQEDENSQESWANGGDLLGAQSGSEVYDLKWKSYTWG